MRRALAASVALIPALVPGAAWGQRAGENAVASSTDAFGTTVGSDTTGIYNENDTRGLSPLKAGNARLDGLYFDPVATISSRLRASYGIRVGTAANDHPFPAPTGIVDNKLRSAGNDFVASLSLARLQYGGELEELDLQIPLIADQLSLSTGVGHAATINGDGASSRSVAFLVKPVLRWNGAEISPFFAGAWIYDIHARPIFQTSGALIPPLPRRGHYLGQDWARGRNWSENLGLTAHLPLSSGLTLRAGAFRSGTTRHANYTEIFAFSSPARVLQHRLISDPRQDLHSWSGEMQLSMRLGGERWRHRLIAGFRARQRYTESGGSDFRDFGAVDLDGFDVEPEPSFSYSPVNVGKVRQSSVMLGYQGRLADVGQVNLGIQRARYRAVFHDSRLDTDTATRTNSWLYNASVAVNLTEALELFVGTQRGLEDSGAAPENAANRNEQLPTTRSTQYEGGLRWHLGRSHLVVSAFQISKPYLSFDAANRYVELGTARYRGLEASLAGHFGDRLNVLAGAVAMKPEVSGPGRLLGLVAERPTGTPSLYARVDVQYRTDILDGLTPTMTLIYTGRRAVGSRPVPALGGGQLMLAPLTSLDLGLRHKFRIGATPASLRVTLANVFNSAGWKVVASNSLQPEERRRLTMILAADF